MSGRLAAEAIAAHETVDVGDGLLLLAADEAAFDADRAARPVSSPCCRSGTRWTMGYPLDGRSRFLDREVHDRVFDGDGNGLGMVLVDGRAAGAWVHRARGHRDGGRPRPVRPVRGRLAAALDDAFADIAGFLGYRRAVVREVDTVIPIAPASAARSTDGYGA